MTKPLEAVIIEPRSPADACVVWLHGLGADGNDFVTALPGLDLPTNHRIRFVFPHAPHQPVTINNHMVMPAWFDILGLDANSAQDAVGIKKAQARIDALLEDIIAGGIPAERIILIGFSQGGALALHTALRFQKPLAGVAALSSYLPLADTLAAEVPPANKNIAIFMGHGLLDNVVSYWLGEMSLTHLTKAGFEPMWHTYAIAHTVSLQELSDVGIWIQHQLER